MSIQKLIINNKTYEIGKTFPMNIVANTIIKVHSIEQGKMNGNFNVYTILNGSDIRLVVTENSDSFSIYYDV